MLAGLEITNEMMSESNKETPSKTEPTMAERKKSAKNELEESKEAKEEEVDGSLSLKLVDEISELSKL